MKHHFKILTDAIKHNFNAIMNRNLYPEFLVFYVTFRCDSRCKACNIWKGDDDVKKKNELTTKNIDIILSDPLFKRLENINIQGGEATQREDLPKIIKVIIDRIPSLKEIGITSNGLNTDVVVEQARNIYELCRKNSIHFSLGLSIDGVGKYHDLARGEGAFDRVTKTLNGLKSLKGMPGFSLGTNCVLTAQNIDNIDEIIRFQRDTFGITNLTVVEFREHFMNERGSPESKMTLFTENAVERDKLIDFLKEHNYPGSIDDFQAYRYEQLRAMIEDGVPRRQSCQYRISGLVLDHLGDLMLCPVKGKLGNCLERSPSEIYFSSATKKIRKEMIHTVCRNCYPYNFYEVERHKDIVKHIIFFIRSRIRKITENI